MNPVNFIRRNPQTVTLRSPQFGKSYGFERDDGGVSAWRLLSPDQFRQDLLRTNMTAVEVGGWFASTFIGKLVDKACSYLAGRYEYATCVQHKLKSLEEDLRTIKAVLIEADQRIIENRYLKEWLLDLKDAAYEAEDVIDMFEYKNLEDKIEEKGRASSSTSHRLFKRARTTVESILFSDEDVEDLCKVAGRFRKIAEERETLLMLIASQPTVSLKVQEIMRSRETTSMAVEPQLFGRDSEKTHLIELLLQTGSNGGTSHSKHVHVLPIVGIGGVGKTSLVQEVYNDQIVKSHYDLRAWVCVSDNFEVKRLTKELIESASIPWPEDFHNLQNFGKIADILSGGLTGKRFLIVLDDVWEEVAKKWEDLQSILNSGKEGSRIVITTRIQKIADMVGTQKAMALGCLPDKDFWKFFLQCALGHGNPENHPNLECFGRKIATKLGGLPLAAKTVGAVLRCNLKEEYWREILESKLWQVDQKKDGIMPVLRLSYDYLPVQLKQCFVYCSMFPKGYMFSEDKLVQLWIAQGFIQPDGEKTMEKIGKVYFNQLLGRSFFQMRGNGYGFVMHDLLHDVAEYLSDGESFRAEDPLSESKPIEIMNKIRHAYVSAVNLFVICNNKYVQRHLRSLVVVGNGELSLHILKELKGLRVLILNGLNQKLTSESFQQMLHLRYLLIDEYNYQRHYELPESLCKLYHLQVLSVGGQHHWYGTRNDHFLCLPKGINRLINLRHLVAYSEKTAGIGTLTSIQELCFYVEQKERGFEIGQLGGMSQLKELKIRGLESVESKEQASEVKLRDKRNLENLTLQWGSGGHVTNNPDGVLEGLEPHQNLNKYLGIFGYNGKKCPSWWSGNWVSHLNTIVLDRCSNLEIIPPMGQLPFLKVLRLWGLNGVKRIGPEFYGSNNTTCSKAFPSLEKLEIRRMLELTEWCSRAEGLELFPRLSVLIVKDCPNLKGPLRLPSQLRGLNIFINCSFQFSDGCGGALTILCPSVPRLKEWVPCENIASVERVEFVDLQMTSFPSEELGEWFQHLTSLRSLAFFGCFHLQSLPSKLINNLPALQELTLFECYGIKSLPEEGLPSSLTKLQMKFCSRELAERCEKYGVDWHKIFHIPTIQIEADE